MINRFNLCMKLIIYDNRFNLCMKLIIYDNRFNAYSFAQLFILAKQILFQKKEF